MKNAPFSTIHIYCDRYKVKLQLQHHLKQIILRFFKRVKQNIELASIRDKE